MPGCIEGILCGGAPKIRASLIRRLPKLKAIVRFGIGVDRIDLGEATRCGIYVVNVPDYCIEEVATHAMTLVLAWARKFAGCLQRHDKWKMGYWSPWDAGATTSQKGRCWIG